MTLPRSSPEPQGIPSSAILQFVEALETQIQEPHSFMLLRHGHVVAEGWWSPYASQYPHMVFSLSKSFTSTAVGLAIEENDLSLDDTVLSLFPDEAPTETNPLLESMQVRHLLSMSTGQAVDTWSSMVDRSDGDWIRGFFSVPVLHTPGTHFVYNTGATYMLSAIMQKCTGMKLVDYLEQKFFDVIGIHDATWEDSPQGITAGGIGLCIKTEDIARFGQFYLQNGRWQNQQLLTEAWIQEATTAQISNNDGIQQDWTQGYGYQFWRCRHNAYRGDGVFGQYCVVMPEQDAVLAITGGMDVFDMQQPLNLVWDILLPAMQASPLPDNISAHQNLTDTLNTLGFAPVNGKADTPIVEQISGRTYAIDANDLLVDSMTFSFTSSNCEITVETTRGQDMIVYGYGTWQRGQTNLFSQPTLFEDAAVATSGTWTGDQTFTVIFRLYETPFYYTMDCHFDEAEILIEIQVNVSLESMKPIVLIGQYS